MSLTEEQIKEALKSSAFKDAVKAAVDAEVEGLKNKRDELLGTVKELKGDLKKIQDEKDEAERKAADKSGDVAAIREQLEKAHKKEVEKLTADITKMSSQLQTHIVSGGLKDALVKAKVAPAMIEAAEALILKNYKGEVGDNDGKPFAKFDGKTVDEFVTGWTQTESGKHFVVADTNNGGGSNGANGNGKAATGKTITRSAFDVLSPADKAKTMKDGVQIAD